MSPLIINLLKAMLDDDISFTIKKSELKPKEYGTLQVEFDNGWCISVVDDNGEYSIQTTKDEYDFYYNCHSSEVEKVKGLVLRTKYYVNGE